VTILGVRAQQHVWERIGGPSFAQAIGGVSDHAVWVAYGDTYISHYDGTTWTGFNANNAGRISGIWMASETLGYASATANVVLRWDGTNWGKEYSGIPGGSTYLSPARLEPFRCDGTLIRTGKTLSYAEAYVLTDDGRLVAHGASTLMRLPGLGVKLGLPLWAA